MLSFYLVLSAALLPVIDIFCDIFRQSYSWWLVPLLFLAFFIAFIGLHILFVVIFIQLINTDKPIGNKVSTFFRGVAEVSLSMAFKLARVHIHTTGADLIPENKRFLLVCNHINDLDPTVIIEQLRGYEIAFIGKKEIYSTMKFVSKAMHALRCLPIDRENNREAAKTIISASKLIKGNISSVGIFPEGYTSKTGELLPFRNGAFKIAVKAQAPIVVCTIANTQHILKNMFRRKTDIYFDVLEVIDAGRVCSENTNELGDYISKLMAKRLAELKNN